MTISSRSLLAAFRVFVLRRAEVIGRAHVCCCDFERLPGCHDKGCEVVGS